MESYESGGGDLADTSHSPVAESIYELTKKCRDSSDYPKVENIYNGQGFGTETWWVASGYRKRGCESHSLQPNF